MKKIIALGGSNSKKSINKQLAIYTAKQLTNTETIIVDLNDFELPLFGVDLEAEIGSPENAKKLDKLLSSADGLIISLAEHNSSYSAVFKNTFDWLSRIDGQVWKQKPMLLMATSTGGRGGASVLSSAENRFPRMGGNIVAQFSLPFFNTNFIDGELVNEELKAILSEKVALLQAAI